MPRDRSAADMRAFGSAVQAARYELGATQEELAHRAMVHRTYLADIERGQRNPSLKIICRIARALDLSTSELMADAKL